MKLFAVVQMAVAVLPAASAHYIFSKLIVGDKVTDEYEYVRKNSNSNSPLMDVKSLDFRCNAGAQTAAPSTKTYTVAAGSKIGVGVGMGGNVIHPGPLLVYMSRAPQGIKASDYDGSGDWFKIYELGTSSINDTAMSWVTTGGQQFTWNLPKNLPPGDYLMRTEHIALHEANRPGGTQYYAECAQLTVTGGDVSAKPGPTVKIPGVYSGTEPGIEINIYYPVPTHYDFPGPAIWPVNAGNDLGVGNAHGSGPSSPSPPPANSPSPASSASSVASPLTGGMPGAGASGVSALYGQCGGANWNGPKACAGGSTCQLQNPYYSQCLPAKRRRQW